jgi:hypothetical protein
MRKKTIMNKYLLIMYTNNLLQEETERIKNLISEQTFLGGPAMGIVSPRNTLKTFNWIKTWDNRDWLNFVEMTTGILGSIPSPASPFLLGISIGAGIANAKLYYDGGDPYTAGLYLAFSVIPVASLIKQLKFSKTFMRLGKDGSVKLLEKIKSGTATASEQKMAKDLVREIGPVSNELGKEVVRQTISKILSELPKKSLSFVIKLCLMMYNLGVFGIRAGVTIGGTFLSYDLMYRALNYKNKKNMSLREKNEMAKVYNFIVNNEDEIKTLSIDDIKKNQSSLLEHSNSFISIDTTHEIKF